MFYVYSTESFLEFLASALGIVKKDSVTQKATASILDSFYTLHIASIKYWAKTNLFS